MNVQRFGDKAYLRGADCIIMDLEDPVPASEKEAARGLIKESIPVIGKGGGDIAVRINNSIEEATADLEASVWPGPTCVAIPKVESAEEVRIRDGIISELEEDSIKRAHRMLRSTWIGENQALKVLIEKLRDDEKRHHNALKKLSEKPFFRIDPNDFTVIFQGEEFAEERHRKSKEFREKRDEEKVE